MHVTNYRVTNPDGLPTSMQTLLSKHWHRLPGSEVVELLDTHVDSGLGGFEANGRLQHFGPNALTARKGKGPWLRLALQFHQPLIYILIVAGAITAGLQEWVDSSVIFGVVLVNAFVGFIQESRALKALEALARTMTAECTVIRDGEPRRISSREVVPGDVVMLQSGDKVPADLRLFHERDLQIDESALTGESVPVQKLSETLAQDAVLADRRNMAYASSLVTYGQGKGVVVATGDKTEVGRISQLIAQAEDIKTPLTRKIAAFSHVLLYIILAVAGGVFAIGLFKGESMLDMFMAAVALAVAAIPEGLPAAVTIILAIGVARMAKRRAIIRKLPAVETLGSTTIICTDKTGTLTENQMTVREIYDGFTRYETSGVGYAPAGHILKDGAPLDGSPVPAVAECLRCGVLCNDSLLLEKDGQWVIQGDPTEGALIVSAHKLGIVQEAEDERWPRIESIPFESAHQYMATLHDRGSERSRTVFVKGAVEVILERCTDGLDPQSHARELDREHALHVAEELAGKGLRVLAFARKELPAGVSELNHTDVASGLTFLGLQGMIDPPRPEAIEAVRECRHSGIRVKMITGDHALTAASIAKEMRIDNGSDQAGTHLRVLTGKDLERMDEAAIIDAAQQTKVFARVSPEQKLRLVRALQARNEVVAMTGDGVNDAPALKQANIGVAMGMTGTEVAKEAADMVLTDDNFATIVAAVEEGRGVFDNLTKFIVWTLPTNAGEGLVVVTAIMTGAMLPLLPVHILWINMTTAVLLGMMLAFEPKEADIMSRPPRDPKTPLLSRDLVMRIGLVALLLLGGAFGLFKWERWQGADVNVARTVAVNTFVMIELFYLFNCRSLTKSMFTIGVFSNRWVHIGALAMVGLQMVFTYIPFMNRALQTAPISMGAWVRIVGVALAVYFIVGLEKAIRHRTAAPTTAIRRRSEEIMDA